VSAGTPAELTQKTGQRTLADAFIELTGRNGDRRPPKEDT
jgi:hypothetical protein